MHEIDASLWRDIVSAHERWGQSQDGPGPAAPQAPVARAIETFTRWLYLPDPDVLYAVFGAVAAHRLPGDPVWILVVAPPGWGKTEVIAPLAVLADVHPAATLTEGALLSGTPKREAKEGNGGLLRKIGASGIILAKDFGSVLSMHRDGQAAVLAALREVYDGSWTRHVGTDGGRTLHWEGRVGMVAGCTPAIDNHHAVMGAMGERFALYRLPEADEAEQAARAMAAYGQEERMRAELGGAVRDLFAVTLTEPGGFVDGEIGRLIASAILACRGRSAVYRDRMSREIELIHGAEAPARLVKALARLMTGMWAIGVPRPTTWRVITKMALDSIPAVRRRMLDNLAVLEAPAATPDLAEQAGYPTNTARRALEDLTVYGLVARTKVGPGKPDLWELTETTRGLLATAHGDRTRNIGGRAEGEVKKAPDALLSSPDIAETVPSDRDRGQS